MLEVNQMDAAAPKALVNHFFEDETSANRPGGYEATLGALAARTIAERHRGKATFEAVDHGSRLTMTFN